MPGSQTSGQPPDPELEQKVWELGADELREFLELRFFVWSTPIMDSFFDVSKQNWVLKLQVQNYFVQP